MSIELMKKFARLENERMHAHNEQTVHYKYGTSSISSFNQQERREEVVKLWEEGWTMTAISKELRVSRNTVANDLIKMGKKNGSGR